MEMPLRFKAYTRKFILNFCCLGVGLGSACAAEVIVKVAPPRAIVEHRAARPGARHIWIAGFYRWNGYSYVWQRGRWEVPPRTNAVWVSARWKHRLDGYEFVEGRWR